MSNGRNRSGRAKKRKTEISRDFSVFFDPNFFKISIDPFSIFFRVEGFELPKTQFFQNLITNESNTKDLNPRQGFILFHFFMLVTKCLQIVYYKTNPSLLQGDSNPKIRKMCFSKSIHLPHQRTWTSESQKSTCWSQRKATATKPWQVLLISTPRQIGIGLFLHHIVC